MQLQKKLGFGFILFGVVLIIAMYFLVNSGAFLFSSLIGLMAIFFGAFQLMIAGDLAVPTEKHSTKHKAKKGRHK